MTGTYNTHELEEGLKSLYLSTIRQCYMEEAETARREALSYEMYLQELVNRECEECRRKRIARYLRESRLPAWAYPHF